VEGLEGPDWFGVLIQCDHFTCREACIEDDESESGVPTSDDDRAPYFHIRFEFKGADASKFLPDYCVMTRKTGRIENILGIDRSLLKKGQIEEAWRVIGEQSEWVLNMLDIYKEYGEGPLEQITQFLHYYFNMLQLSVKCPKCGGVIHL
jgi:hypothetical protein